MLVRLTFSRYCSMKKMIIVRSAFSLCLFSVLLLGSGAFSEAQAELSQQFRENLQRQYESGHIPDPKKNMSYEERLAIRKKQQKLEEEQQKRQQNLPSPPPARQERDNRHREVQDRYDDNRSSLHRPDRSYERIQEYCRSFSRPGTYEFSRCLRENGEVTWGDRNRSRDDDRSDRYNPYDRSNRYDRYERGY